MKNFNGKAIYQPSGKAAEYSKWACNFFCGCSNGCTYCYLKKGRGAKILGGSEPKLKKCFKDETDALNVFKKELQQNLSELQKHGLFFSFTTDPMLPEPIELTWDAVGNAIYNGVPVKILTKRTDWVDEWLNICEGAEVMNKDLYAFGFTLTGQDEVEPNASPNIERMEAMKKLHDAGFKTWASIEPVINFADSLIMIEYSAPYCDLFKIGLKSGDKHHFESVREFIENVVEEVPNTPLYFKDSLLAAAAINRNDITRPTNFVDRDFNIWRDELREDFF